MARLTEPQREKLRSLTVEFLLAARAAYLATPQANALKHWEQLQNRVLSAARRSATADEWTTAVLRGLQVTSLASSGSSSLHDLCAVVREHDAATEWLDLIQRETGLLFAMARLAAEARKAAREEGKNHEA